MTDSNAVPASGQRRIVAMGGGGFSMEPDNPLLDDYVLSLARTASTTDGPSVCFVPTASGDSDTYLARFYRAFAAKRCRPTELRLFDRSVSDLEAFVLAQDVIYVGGGNTANLLAVWRVHGLDQLLRRAWESGTVMCGLSAGMICWFKQSTSDSFDLAELAPLNDGLGLLDASACPHYDGEHQRRPLFHELIGSGVLRDGWAADDGAALVFDDQALLEVVSSRPGARGYRVWRTGENQAAEEPLPTRYLG